MIREKQNRKNYNILFYSDFRIVYLYVDLKNALRNAFILFFHFLEKIKKKNNNLEKNHSIDPEI